MAESLSILEFLQKMIDDVGLRDWFADEPAAGAGALRAPDSRPRTSRDAIVLVDDSQTADFSRNFDTGFHGTLGATAARALRRTTTAATATGHQEAVEHLSRYVTNNFVDDRDTTVDNSVNQQIDTHGGDFDQDIDDRLQRRVRRRRGAAADDIRDST